MVFVAALITAALITVIMVVGRTFERPDCAPFVAPQSACAAAQVGKLVGWDEEHASHAEVVYVHVGSSDVAAVVTATASPFFDFVQDQPIRLRRMNPATLAMLEKGNELPPWFPGLG